MKKKRKSRDIFAIGDVLVSEEVTTEMFVCDLAACKGACCVEGDVGAPLEKEELKRLEQVYPGVAPYLPEAGRKAIEEQGYYVRDITGSISTPLVEGRECAYTVFDEKGVALCGIEKAYFDGKISFRKPVSCHLYPIRITRSKKLEALNYDRWDICAPACTQGASLGIRVYEFVKEALIRKYGKEFYKTLDKMVKAQQADYDDE